jgi:hypothetical protein
MKQVKIGEKTVKEKKKRIKEEIMMIKKQKKRLEHVGILHKFESIKNQKIWKK